MSAQQLANLSEQALQAFQRDLTRLLAQRAGQWVAYQGERQLAFAPHKHELYQECFRRGLQPDEFVVFCIEPQETEMTLGPFLLD
jgi:hypothetical protein